jgi:leucyl/phenylalanyl-tRNA---protein transferase
MAARAPTEPPAARWAFPPAETADEDGLVGVGADLEPGTVLAAYRSGLFPMPLGQQGHIGWWSPDPRAVIPLDELRVSRSLRRSLGRYEIRVDTAFDEVVAACADPGRPHGWISPAVRAAYRRLHDLGWAHSVEAWMAGGDDGDAGDGRAGAGDGQDPTGDEEVLAGGLYGLAIGGLFAGESMFHRQTDASKVALVALVGILQESGDPRALLDVQWQTSHLASLGAVEVPRSAYLARLSRALAAPLPAAFCA